MLCVFWKWVAVIYTLSFVLIPILHIKYYNLNDELYWYIAIVVYKDLPAAPSLNLVQGQCELATDYVKKKNTLRLR